LPKKEDFDEEQHFILKEVVRYLDGQTSEGGFQQMAAGWPHLVERIFSGGNISGNDPEVINAIKSWHQQQASICAWLGRELQRHVSLELSRGHRESQSIRLLEDAEEFVTTNQLRASFHSPALARPIEIVADAVRRNVTCRCSIGAPEDRRRYQSRMSWLLEQLPENSVGDTMVHITWDNDEETCVGLRKLRRNEQEGRVEGALPVSFALSRSFNLADRFGGPRIFIESVDTAVSTFCDSIARHLRAWQPRPIRRTHVELAQEEEGSADRVVVREANIPQGRVKVFDDGSFELQTDAGTTWYRNVTELERSLRSKDTLRQSQEPVRREASHDGGNGSATGPLTATETLPTDPPSVGSDPGNDARRRDDVSGHH
jgi:hypothetical protein